MLDESNDSLLRDVSEASARLMAGMVPRKTMLEMQKMAQVQGSYPWQEVVQRILQDSVAEQELVQQSIRSQRDWIQRGGRETPKKSLGRRTKGLFAAFLAKILFFGIYTAAVVLLLNLARHVWPDLNIYWLLDQAKATFPKLFSR